MPMATATIIYGTAWKKEATARLVVAAVLNGFRAIDTACQPKHYQELLVGQALKILEEKHNIKRQDLFLQTKYTSIGGQDKTKPLPYDPSASITQQVHASFQKSLSNLHTTYLDSYILHSPLHTLDLTLEAWRVLMALQDSGQVRMIGLSNTYDVQTLRILGKERKVQVVQNRWYEGNGWDTDIVKYCQENGIMYQSFWTLTGSPSLLKHPALSSLATDLKCTLAQAAYKFAQHLGLTPLSGTTDENHMKEDIAVTTLSGESEAPINQLKAFIGM